MYSHCLHCQSSLGANALIEAFPVGRTLAFDGAKGRLWVVCRRCSRWNLSPLEERWEAIESCERLYRGTPLRASTDQIGLARLSEGLSLVRVGTPTRPEFAAWRYGREFSRRHWKAMAMFSGIGLLTAGFMAWTAGSMIGVTSTVPFGGALVQLPNLYTLLRRRRVLAELHNDDGGLSVLRAGDLGDLMIERGPAEHGGWQLRVKGRRIAQPLVGHPAERLLTRALAELNGEGGNAKTVNDAVGVLVETGSREAVFDRVLTSIEKYRLREWRNPTPAERLALEMALHEDTERAAVEGDLAALTAAWQEAESIAKIADDLLVPGWLRRRLHAGASDSD